MSKRARVHEIYDHPLNGDAIERVSFATIDREVDRGAYSADEWEIVRRLIHASADLSLKDLVRFSPDAIPSACEALTGGRPVVVDSNMIRAGLSLPRLRRAARTYEETSIHCGVADVEVIDAARRAGLPRAIFAIRRFRPMLDGALVLFGNSPVGLLELNRMILEEGVRPALVVGMPVGFVHVEESKEELMTLPVPWIAVAGRRGGSPLAVAALHALSGLASRHPATGKDADAVKAKPEEAIILLGHGSRVPEAGDSMQMAAEGLKKRYGHLMVEVCFLSRLPPHLNETLLRCVSHGAKHIIVIPYFLHGGLHIKLDIPEMLQTEAKKYPGVKLVLGDRLGFDEALVDVIEKRIRSSLAHSDVRSLDLPPRERFPVPAGQREFVAVPPELVPACAAYIEQQMKEERQE